MKAVIVATEKFIDKSSDKTNLSIEMPLMDRPFIYHVIEQLVHHDIKNIDLITSNSIEKINELLNDGSRWGISLNYHDVRSPEDVYKKIIDIEYLPDSSPFLLVHGQSIPDIDFISTKPDKDDFSSILYAYNVDNENFWSGWGWIFKNQLDNFKNSQNINSLYKSILGDSEKNKGIVLCKVFSASSYPAIYSSHLNIIRKKENSFIFAGNEVENGVWISRNVKIHPTAKIFPPVYLGKNSEISESCIIGPNAIIGKNCYVGKNTEITDSVIFFETYIGEALEINKFLINRKQIFNVKSGAMAPVPEDFILGDLSKLYSKGAYSSIHFEYSEPLHNIIKYVLLAFGHYQYGLKNSIDYDFSFRTTMDISLQVSVSLPSSSNEKIPLSKVPIKIWDKLPAQDDEDQNDAKILLSGATNDNGIFQNYNFSIPSYLDEVIINTDFIGFPPFITVPITNHNVSFDYYDYFYEQTTKSSTSSNVSFRKKIVPMALYAPNYPSNCSIMGTWNSAGVPDYLEPVRDIIDAQLLDSINASLPERQKVPENNPEYIATTTETRTVITGDSNADVWVTFVHEGAGYKNVLGFYTYNINDPPQTENDIANKTIIFPNVSYMGSGGGLISGDKVKLGNFEPGTVIEWFVFANGYRAPNVTEGYWIVYSDSRFNDESDENLRQHTVLLRDAQNRFILAFEDIRRDNRGCDQDFNDAIFYVTSNPISAISTINVAEVKTSDNADSDNDGILDAFDDYKLDQNKAFANNSNGVLAFEDLWPKKGDYDFNDLVINYNFNRITNADSMVVEIIAEFTVSAIGASLDNGFAFEMPVNSDKIESVEGTIIYENYISLTSKGLESPPAEDHQFFQTRPIVIVTDNLNKFMDRTSSMTFINTVIGQPYISPKTITIVITLNTPVSLSEIGSPPFNPFIMVDKTRMREVHLPDMSPTAMTSFDFYLGSGDDTSNPYFERYFKTQSNLPWALHIPEQFEYPVETEEITKAFLKFADWAMSSGTQYADWYKNISGYRNSSFIYSH